MKDREAAAEFFVCLYSSARGHDNDEFPGFRDRCVEKITNLQRKLVQTESEINAYEKLWMNSSRNVMDLDLIHHF